MIKLWETIYYLIILVEAFLSTYDHRSERAAGPVRSPVHKLRTGRLVFEWVTIGESLLLYVFLAIFVLFLTNLTLVNYSLLSSDSLDSS
jgi:hypothetical protein